MKSLRTMTTKVVLFSLIISTTLSAQTNPASDTKAERLQIAAAMDNSIKTELLNKWYPQSVDSLYGGFISTYTFDFKPTGPQDKFIVIQARHTWTTSKAALAYPEKTYYIKCAQNGFHFLRDVMWDKQYGGFYNL